MNILWDLRGCQRWRERGIPRYIQNLVLAFAHKRPGHQLTFLYDRLHPTAIWHDELSRHGRFAFVDEIPPDSGFDWLISGWVFVPLLAQGCLSEYLLPPRWNRATARHLAAIVYDFIPWLYPKDYLPGAAERAQYIETLDYLAAQDLLLTISGCTFADTARLFPQKAGQIVNINGGAGTFRGLAPKIDGASQAILEKHHVHAKRYWVYIGGDDPRKNLETLIRAQSSRARQSGAHPLLIVCFLSPERQKELQRLANQSGGDVRLTGFVSDDVLWTLLANAYGLVYPSLYEGLGLPIIESYLVGTPAICSNTASMKDLAPADWLFDPSGPAGIAGKLTQAEAAGDGFRKSSLAFWAEKSHEYSWDHSAEVLAQSLEEKAVRPLPRKTSRPPDAQSPAWFCALPPEQSGVAVYNHGILNDVHALPSYVLYGNRSGPPDEALESRHTLLPIADFWRVEDRFSSLIFVLGNSGHHTGILGVLDELRHSKKRRILYLHDGQLTGLWTEYWGSLGAVKQLFHLYYPELREAIDAASDHCALSKAGARGVRPLAEMFGFREFIVHSAAAEAVVRAEVAGDVNVHRLFLPVVKFDAQASRPGSPRRAVRIGSFGIADAAKGTDKVYLACKELRASGVSIELILAGYNQSYSRRLLGPADGEWVTLCEGLSDQQLEEQMRGVDLAIQLREASYGEASGVVTQMLGMGKPLICSQTGWFEDLVPFVHLVPRGVGVERLKTEIQTIMATGYQPSDVTAIEAKLGMRPYWQKLRNVLAEG